MRTCPGGWKRWRAAGLERRWDQQFRAVFDAIGELMAPEELPRSPIGFAAEAKP
jgi:hypothetical protein